MYKRHQQIFIFMMAPIMLVALLGASQAVSTRGHHNRPRPENGLVQQPGELIESDNSGQNIELVGHLGGTVQPGKTGHSPALR
jgi:hypothetical protein